MGNDNYGRPVGQTIRSKTIGNRPFSYTVGVQNDGTEADRIPVRETGADRKFRVGYKIGDRKVTSALKRGLPHALDPGESQRIKSQVKATRHTKGKNARKGIRFLAASAEDRTKRDPGLPLAYKKKGDRYRSHRNLRVNSKSFARTSGTFLRRLIAASKSHGIWQWHNRAIHDDALGYV
ncbi:MAG: hypothetical protein ABF384_12200 [Verrucomicrobiales bacterium]